MTKRNHKLDSKLKELGDVLNNVKKLDINTIKRHADVFKKLGIQISYPAKICFCAIFRNESKNVKRCFDAAKPMIDYLYISDTGSTDDTIELIKEWGKENKIPTTVETEEFKNFGHNRTISFERAVKAFPQADYVLLIDADMVIKFGTKFNRNVFKTLSPNGKPIIYYFKQRNSSIVYDNVRMISTKVKAKCVGVTHEYWDAGSDCEQMRVPEEILYIDDIGDGGHKQDKFVRDINLLEAGIEAEADNEHLVGRYYFYLAQSYKATLQYEKAIETYKKRLDKACPPEEHYYSLYQIGNCYLESGKGAKAIEYWNKAWNYRPTRAEALAQITKYYCLDLSLHHVAVMYGEMGRRMEMPNDTLFVEYEAHDYKFAYYLSISYFYISEKEKGKKEIEYLRSIKNKIPMGIMQSIESNSKFYD